MRFPDVTPSPRAVVLEEDVEEVEVFVLVRVVVSQT